MTLRELVSEIVQKHEETGINVNPPASEMDILNFQQQIGLELPGPFKEFYLICNGFVCTEDLFRMIPLHEAFRHPQGYGKNWFHFAEYMTYCDMWSLRKTDKGSYEIFNKGESEIVLTTSLHEFLLRFLQGNVFDTGGLNDWHQELKMS